MFAPTALSLSLLLSVASATLISGATRCQSFGASLNMSDVKVLHTTYYTGNETIPLDDLLCNRPGATVGVQTALCRIALLVDTSATSQVQLEAWLPDEWSERVAVVGNGGLNGCIDYSNLAYLSSFNFAVIGSNNGHNGSSGDAFLNAPETIIDFTYRSVHVSSELTKSLSAAYYNTSHKKSYYFGCSTGGRQGFSSIQRYPEDFDGVVAGAPALDFNHLAGWDGILSVMNGAPSGKPIISSELWEAVRLDALRQCDAIDGVKDGIIDNPDRCHYTPEKLLCTGTGGNTTVCLTTKQAEIVNFVFSPLYGLKGELVFPRYDPGTSFAGLAMMVFGGQLFPFTLDWWRNTVYNDTTWTGEGFNLQNIADADRIDPGGVSTINPDISAYQKKGGKVVHYHGMQDSLIPSGNSRRYHASVLRTLGPKKLNTFYRYFPVPGMDHCGGGPGPNVFGQGGLSAEGVPKDAQNNIVLATVKWVEEGVAPEQLIATKWKDDIAGNLQSRRTICAWPKTSVKRGSVYVCV